MCRTAAWSGVTDDGKEAAMANIKIAEATRTAQPASRPAVTVVVVSDYVEARQKSWTDERAVLRALGEQDFLESFEVILMENGTVQGSTPADLLSRCPGSRMEFSEATTSAELKDAGVMRANGELIAILEADCVPAPDWLRHMVSALRERPDYAAASGKTLYPGRSMFVRCLTLLDRSVYPGGSGPTASISNNNSIVRRGVLDRYPYPATPSPFLSAALRWREMQRDGLRFFSNPTPSSITLFRVGRSSKTCGLMWVTRGALKVSLTFGRSLAASHAGSTTTERIRPRARP
jgi:cellulose synthase/poly-beta-1,6-N-acetylglucosamine synthase-like glycosyltransferase